MLESCSKLQILINKPILRALPGWLKRKLGSSLVVHGVLSMGTWDHKISQINNILERKVSLLRHLYKSVAPLEEP